MKRIRSILLAALVASSTFGLLQGAMPAVSTGTWQQAGPMTNARRGASSVLLTSGGVLVSGGVDGSGTLDSVELFGADGTFSAVVPMTSARAEHTSVLLPDGRVLVVGGRQEQPAAGDLPASTAALAEAELFSAGTWTPVGLLTDARWGHTATVSTTDVW